MAAANAAVRAPKQWSLTEDETITTFESWRQNLKYVLSLDANFATFLQGDTEWEKKTRAAPLRVFADDGEEVPAAQRRTAAQKVIHLELMLGQIANFCPIISRNTLVKNSTSLENVWQSIRAHFGFQTTGAHFIDFADMKLKPGEKPESLYQRLMAFVEDNLLTTESGITHHNEDPDEDEELTPMVENIIVLTWLRLIHPELPALVKQRYGTELRNQTLASIKPEISQAMSSLLECLNSSEEARVMRSTGRYNFNQGDRGSSSTTRRPASSNSTGRQSQNKQCPLCTCAGRPNSHYLSQCTYLPASDKKFIAKARLLSILDEDLDLADPEENEPCEYDDEYFDQQPHARQTTVTSNRHVKVCPSPTIPMTYRDHDVTAMLDSGGESNMIIESKAKSIGAVIQPTKQSALQADGKTPMDVRGETEFVLNFDKKKFRFHGLVVADLDVEILAGMPFLCANDILLHPCKSLVIFNDGSSYRFPSSSAKPSPPHRSVRLVSSHVLRAPPTNTTLYPGDYIDVTVPSDLKDQPELALEPRLNNSIDPLWPQPSMVTPVCGKVRISNDTDTPIFLKKNVHFGQLLDTYAAPTEVPQPVISRNSNPLPSANIADIKINPDNLLPPNVVAGFNAINHKYRDVFNSHNKLYNGLFGPLEAVVNMGPSLPPQRKGRVPQYSRDKLVELQDKFDELKEQGVFVRPDEVGVVAEYLNPSFLVNEPAGGHRLVTSFGEVAKYAKPQPALMPDINDTLRLIGTWKFIIKTDLSSAYYQIPLSKDSMKFCGVCTPFKGVLVYARPSMGMPGSETALEQMMSLVIGDLVTDGVMAKVADDLFVGGETPEQLLDNYSRMLSALAKANLGLSPKKTEIAPLSTTILGWIWSDGKLSASPHRIATLAACSFPSTVKQMRSFIGAYKFLSRVIPRSSDLLSPLEESVAGKSSCEKIARSESLEDSFTKAQNLLSSNKTITIAKPSDQLWIVTDGSMQPQGLGSTLYITRNGQLHLSGHFSAKLKDRQNDWVPCEIEALCIAASIKHFAPYITQSLHTTCVLTDSKPCVQAYEKLCRGEFSNSSRVTTFLSVASRYPLHVRHLKGSVNLPADFACRNAVECTNTRCQICNFVGEMTIATVNKVTVSDIQSGAALMPFTTRSTWLTTQNECADLRRVKAHLQQGTRPSKKLTNCKDIKRYLNIASLSRDGLLIVPQQRHFCATSERIVVPRQVAAGLFTALHIRLSHPTYSQLKQVTSRYFFSLDMEKELQQVSTNCHTCSSLAKLPHAPHPSSTSTPPSKIGALYASDIVRCNRQFILLLREVVSSFTCACLVSDEKAATIRDGIIQLCVPMRPLDGPPAVIRADPGPGFNALRDDSLLASLRIRMEIGESKNRNKNPIAEKAVQELEDELLRQDPERTSVTPAQLAVVVSVLNSRIRSQGLSSREIWTQRDQYNNDQLPLNDELYISQQYKNRQQKHTFAPKTFKRDDQIQIGDLVYVYSDKDKTHSRPRYLVTSVENEWCFLRKFVGTQLRHNAYKVHRDDCFKIPSFSPRPRASRRNNKNFPSSTAPFYLSDQNVNVIAPMQEPQLAAPPVPEEIVEPLIPEHVEPIGNIPPQEVLPHPEPPQVVNHQNDTREAPPADIDQPRYPPRQRRPPAYLSNFQT